MPSGRPGSTRRARSIGKARDVAGLIGLLCAALIVGSFAFAMRRWVDGILILLAVTD